jgi:hypothetical protein
MKNVDEADEVIWNFLEKKNALYFIRGSVRSMSGCCY